MHKTVIYKLIFNLNTIHTHMYILLRNLKCSNNGEWISLLNDLVNSQIEIN